MTTVAASTSGETVAPSPIMLGQQHWLAALAMIFVLFAPYQTLVQTVITDDEIRLGVEADSYDMIWVNVAYLVGCIYGLFTGTVWSLRFGKRDTLVIGLLIFCVGNVLCGAAAGLYSLAFGRMVEGFGKLMLMAVGRATLYKQFDRALLVAIGFYGVFAYSTRHCTPLINAYIDVYFSWRWTYWAYIPVSLIALVLVWCFFRPDRPPQPVRLRLDWLAITTFVAWLIAIDFAFSWYRRWGGWSSNAFVACVALCVALPLALAAWLGSGLSRDEHLKHVLHSRVYVLSLMTRGLLLLYMAAVLTIVGMYCTELRGYPRVVAGWLMVPTSLAMATTTFLTTWFHSRSLRHVWLIVGMIGCSATVWWLSSIDNFTPKEHLAVMLACWGAFLGLIPPVFLMDEVEGLEPKYMLYGFALGLVGLLVPIETVPNATATMIKAWSDRAVDVYRNGEPPREPGPRSSRLRPESPTISTSGASQRRAPARDQQSPRRFRDARGCRPWVPERPAVPESDDARHRPVGRGLPGPFGAGVTGATRVRLRVMRHRPWTQPGDMAGVELRQSSRTVMRPEDSNLGWRSPAEKRLLSLGRSISRFPRWSANGDPRTRLQSPEESSDSLLLRRFQGGQPDASTELYLPLRRAAHAHCVAAQSSKDPLRRTRRRGGDRAVRFPHLFPAGGYWALQRPCR